MLIDVRDWLTYSIKHKQFTLQHFLLDFSRENEFRNKQRFIDACEGVRHEMKQSGLFCYDGQDYVDVITPQFFGYATNFSTAVKSVVLDRGLKSRVFNKIHYLRFAKQYLLHEGPYLYELQLFKTPTTVPKQENHLYETAFICSVETFLPPFIDLFKVFQKKSEPVLLILPRAAQKWAKLTGDDFRTLDNVHIIFIEDFFTEKDRELLLRAQSHFTVMYKNNQPAIRRILTVEGRDLSRQFQIPVKKFFHCFLPEIVVYHAIAKMIYVRYGVKSVVGGRPRTFIENAFYLAAEKRNVVGVLHASQHDMLDLYYESGQISLVDTFIVPTEYDRRYFLVRRGNAKTRVLCFGNLQMQKIRNNMVLEKNYAKKFHIDSAFVVFTGAHNHPISNVWDVFAICTELGVPLIVKPHPREPVKRYNALKKAGVIVVNDKDVDLYSLLKEARVVISSGSSTTVESLLIGTPSFFYKGVRCYSASDYFIFKRYEGLIPQIEKKDQLKKQLTQYLAVSKKQMMKNYVSFFKDYGAMKTKNVLESIYQCIRPR